ncbi:MAG: GNAT family N-acetyltransferase [Proteobacteria bacterium]|nr:GNAT family N-acetyltransferase [Pseudomonadota bacterium]
MLETISALDRVKDATATDPTLRTYLRLVEPDDAKFICDLRSNVTLNRHLSPSSPSVEAQKQWIEKYKTREQLGTEFYFVIVCDRKEQGVVRMYDFKSDPNSFCWGSWIILPSRPPGLVTFSAILIYDLGFDALHFDQSHFDVKKKNLNVIDFHKRAGANETGADDENLYFAMTRSGFENFRASSSQQIKQHRS